VDEIQRELAKIRIGTEAAVVARSELTLSAGICTFSAYHNVDSESNLHYLSATEGVNLS
jgi:hypothetical protein